MRSIRNGMPDPDLVIRTSGEMRLSNFLHVAGGLCELVFLPCFWPDFTPEHFKEALAASSPRASAGSADLSRAIPSPAVLKQRE